LRYHGAMAFSISYSFSKPLPPFHGGAELTRLCEVCSEGDWALARELANEELCSQWGPSGLTPLMVAIEGAASRPGDSAPFERAALELIRHSDLRQMSRDGQVKTALMMAASAGLDRLVQALLPGSDPLSQDGFGRTALALAACAGQARCVAQLKDFGALEGDFSLNTPLMLAAFSGSRACVDILLPCSDPLAVCDSGARAAHFAAAKGDAPLARLLVEAAGPEGLFDEAGRCVALVALDHGHCAAAALLAGLGAARRDKNGRHLLERALEVADSFGGKEALQDGLAFLINRWAPGFDWMGDDGRGVAVARAAKLGLWRPLLAAAQASSLFERKGSGPTFLSIVLSAGTLEVVLRLLSVEEDPPVELDIGRELALAVGTPWMARLGALPNPRRELLMDGKRLGTAALEAVSAKSEEDIAWIADARLDLEARAPNEDTALMSATRRGLDKFVEALAPLCDTRSLDGAGLSAAWIAALAGNVRCVELLIPWTPKEVLACPLQLRKALKAARALPASPGRAQGLAPLLPWIDVKREKVLEWACSAGAVEFGRQVAMEAERRKVELDFDAALRSAASSLEVEMTRFALRSGCPNARDPQGRDALTLAARAARLARGASRALEAFKAVAMEIALDPRCDPEALDFRGRSAMDWLGASQEDLADCPEVGAPCEQGVEIFSQVLQSRALVDDLSQCAPSAPSKPRAGL
jgi:ankyrin repeat protein